MYVYIRCVECSFISRKCSFYISQKQENSRSTGIMFPRCGNNIEYSLTFLVVLIYASIVSAMISCLRCAERLILSIAPMYTQLMMVDVPPLLMSGSG